MTKSPPHRFPLIAWLALLLASVALLLSLYNFSVATHPAVVTLETEQITQRIVKQVNAQAHTPAAERLVSRQLTRLTAKILRDYAATHSVVVVRQDQVMAGAEDITGDILAMLNASMAAAPPTRGGHA